MKTNDTKQSISLPREIIAKINRLAKAWTFLSDNSYSARRDPLFNVVRHRPTQCNVEVQIRFTTLLRITSQLHATAQFQHPLNINSLPTIWSARVRAFTLAQVVNGNWNKIYGQQMAKGHCNLWRPNTHTSANFSLIIVLIYSGQERMVRINSHSYVHGSHPTLMWVFQWNVQTIIKSFHITWNHNRLVQLGSCISTAEWAIEMKNQ